MPVNWTSGKAKLAKSKFKKRPKKTWKDDDNDIRKKPLPFRRYLPRAKKLTKRSEPVIRHERASTSGASGSRTEGTKRTEIDDNSETISAGLQLDHHSSSGLQTTTSNHQKIDIARKRRALLALTDWAGLHTPAVPDDFGPHTPAPYSARLRRKALAKITPPEQEIVPNLTDELQSTSQERGLQRDSNIHSNLRDNHPFSLSPSSHDSIASPTPANPRAKNPATKLVPISSSKHVEGSNVLKADNEHKRTARSNITGVESKSRSFTYKDESSRKAPSNQPLFAPSSSKKTDSTVGFRPEVPPWICRMSRSLGFSPPTGISEFEKQRAIEIESQHSLPSNAIEHHITPDLELLIKREISPGPDKHSKRNALYEGVDIGEHLSISQQGKGEKYVDEDSKDSRKWPERQKEGHQRTGDQGGGSRNSVTQQKNNRLVRAGQQTPGQETGDTNADWGWRNLVQKSKNDQFDLLFHDRNDDRRIF
ncbi:hypothetical protein PTTG_04244 [Puccinia triticina 1-1 BBBD Race 1]|uniref:Uncharacterized protein n=1 Tax=Puccinia triticina (isolate 1-1 / race 1 (BBBD)) TaxID=630390 RepID=A0A180GFX9_PUCT1|nr:hypothetical protein PTTG_04244 [Puccinia triticina 1-1 BBBD Race 1]WAR51783.1 hypothetical protein PtB15_1B219 [Puccinia triticina]